MRIIADENVPMWISDQFAQRHHEVLRVEDIFMKSAADEVIAMTGNDLDAVVLTRNWRHFREFTSRRLPHGTRHKFRKLDVIEIQCEPQNEERRVSEEIELIEFEHARRLTSSDKRLNVRIATNQIVILR